MIDQILGWLSVGIDNVGAFVTSVEFWIGVAWFFAVMIPVWIVVGYLRPLSKMIESRLVRRYVIRFAAFLFTVSWGSTLWPDYLVPSTVSTWHVLVFLGLINPFAWDVVRIGFGIAYRVVAQRFNLPSLSELEDRSLASHIAERFNS